MGNRIGSVIILVEDRKNVSAINEIISQYSEIIIGRQGIKLSDTGKSVISLVIEGSTNAISGLTGQLGQLHGLSVKSSVLKEQISI